MNILPNKGATEFIDIEVTKDTLKAIVRGVFGAENARVLPKEANIGDLVLETREEISE